MDNKQFEYYAFISYKREDEKWAKWLQDKLRWYKLPAKLCKQVTRLPRRVWPVFRDNTDLGGGVLEQNICGELERSQHLIVICSPEAAQSKWVGKEVEYFASIGKADKIIPFVVSGEPYSNNPETECIHERIKAASKTELLAVNVNEEGLGSKSMKKRRAFIRIVTRLLDIKFNALWQPYERALKIRRWCVGVGIAVLLLGLGFVWDYNRTKYEYYADYVDRWGIPEGVVSLPKDFFETHHACYRFSYQRNLLRKVEYINSKGVLTNHLNPFYKDKPCGITINYNENFNVNKIIYLNHKKEIINILIYSNNCLDITFENKNGGFYGLTYNTYVLPITNIEITRNNKGEIVEEKFKKGPFYCQHIEGYYGKKYDYDSIGRVKKIWYLNKLDQISIIHPTENFIYDSSNKLTNIYYTNIDINGVETKVNNKEGWCNMTIRYNSNNEIVKIKYFTQNNEKFTFPSMHDGADNFSSINYTYYDNWLLKEKFFGEFSPLLQDNLYENDEEHINKYLYKYDNDGRLLYIYLFSNLETEPSEEQKYEYGHNIVKLIRSVKNKGYVETITTKYDNNMNIIEISYLGPCYYEYGGNYPAYTNNTYADNKLIKAALYSPDKKPIDFHGVHSVTFSYNEAGMITEMIYLDKNNQRSLYDNQYSKIGIDYDEYGNRTSIIYYDINDHQRNLHTKPYYFDDLSNKSAEEEYDKNKYDTFQRWSSFDLGYSHHKCIYKDGLLVEELFCNDKDELVNSNATKCAKTIYKYNKYGMLTTMLFYDANNNETANTEWGYAYRVIVDSMGNYVRYDINNNIIPF